MWIELCNSVYGNNGNITKHEQDALTQYKPILYFNTLFKYLFKKLGH